MLLMASSLKVEYDTPRGTGHNVEILANFSSKLLRDENGAGKHLGGIDGEQFIVEGTRRPWNILVNN